VNSESERQERESEGGEPERVEEMWWLCLRGKEGAGWTREKWNEREGEGGWWVICLLEVFCTYIEGSS
jgi:hypothetical protein